MFPSSQTTGIRVQKLSPKRIHINHPWNTGDTMFNSHRHSTPKYVLTSHNSENKAIFTKENSFTY